MISMKRIMSAEICHVTETQKSNIVVLVGGRWDIYKQMSINCRSQFYSSLIMFFNLRITIHDSLFTTNAEESQFKISAYKPIHCPKNMVILLLKHHSALRPPNELLKVATKQLRIRNRNVNKPRWYKSMH